MITFQATVGCAHVEVNRCCMKTTTCTLKLTHRRIFVAGYAVTITDFEVSEDADAQRAWIIKPEGESFCPNHADLQSRSRRSR